MKSSSKSKITLKIAGLLKNSHICIDDLSNDDVLKRNQEFKNQRMNITSFMNETQEFLSKRLPPTKKTSAPPQRRVIKDEEESNQQVFKKRLKRTIIDDDEQSVDKKELATKQRSQKTNVLGINLNSLQLQQKSLNNNEKLTQLNKLSAEIQRNQLTETAPTKRLKRKGEVTLQITQEDQENCVICTNSLAETDVAVLPCKHIFCLPCALRQGESYKNSCPFCRKKYLFVTKGKRMKDGDFIKMETIRVKSKKEQVEQMELSMDEAFYYSEGFSERSLDETSESDSFIVNDNDCEYCGCAEDQDQVRHCSKCQIRTAHLYCLSRPQRAQDQWLCSNCDETQRRRPSDSDF